MSEKANYETNLSMQRGSFLKLLNWAFFHFGNYILYPWERGNYEANSLVSLSATSTHTLVTLSKFVTTQKLKRSPLNIGRENTRRNRVYILDFSAIGHVMPKTGLDLAANPQKLYIGYAFFYRYFV